MGQTLPATASKVTIPECVQKARKREESPSSASLRKETPHAKERVLAERGVSSFLLYYANIQQTQGVYKVKNAGLKEQQARLKKIIATFGTVSFTHVPRDQNSDADALANEAMDRGT